MNWKIKAVRIICWSIGFAIAFGSYATSSKLISVDELHALLEVNDPKVIEVTPFATYENGHIPGAIQVWRPEYADTTRDIVGIMASEKQMIDLFSQLGVLPGQEVILYDRQGLCDAARLWWILDYYGHRNTRILNGGWQAWKAAGYALSNEPTPIIPTRFEFLEQKNQSYYADLNDVLNAIENDNIIIIDTRSESEFKGHTAGRHASRPGKIPGSKHRDWQATMNLEGNHTFKSVEWLQNHFSAILEDPSRTVIFYCQSGTRSAHSTFVLGELLGFNNVKNYDGSWIEWSHKAPPMQAALLADITPLATPPWYDRYWRIAKNAYRSYADYLWKEITRPSWHNYFYWLIGVSIFFFLLEIQFPWRKKQARFRKDFWLDFFYMFFNFFLFSLVIYYAASEVVVEFFNQALARIGVVNLVAFEVQSWPIWAHLLTGFVVRDFVQWWVHRLLHRVPFLWEFHKVHHSVEQMGFAAHLRYHWMENVVYRSIEYIPLALIGIGLNDFFIIHIFTLAVGHWNHSNLDFNIGPLRYIFNHPQMHIWHHAYSIPKERRYGVNFGLTLSIWDYLFGTNYVPSDGRDIRLGFPGMEGFPKGFFGQMGYGLWGGKKEQQEVRGDVK